MHFVSQGAKSRRDREQMMGLGEGCCIKARAVVNRTSRDFSALSDSTKRSVVRSALKLD
jgi:hypothetical protein